MGEKNTVILIDVKQGGFSNKKFDIFNLIWIIDKMSTWTLDEPPTHLTWTSVDIWLTTYPPFLVHVVIECPRIKMQVWNMISAKINYIFSQKNYLPCIAPN